MSLPIDLNSRPGPAKPAASYRALAPRALVSLVLGVLSAATFAATSLAAWSWLALIPIAGLVVGWRALVQIRNAPEDWTGRGLAWFGIGVSVFLWVAGTAWATWSSIYADSFPGYAPIAYEMLQPDPMKPTEPVPQSALDMHDKKVSMKGYMMPSRRQTGIKEFILSPTNGECQFCTPNPKRTEKVRVVLEGDLETTYTTHLVKVAGRFRVEPDNPNGVPYSLEADKLR
ncbi:MAG: DUF3299 domain-containing protein [Planctomycetaceae bacterium]|nr:DUF3299 domain-containing protein [Planctomycetaceae bacterium]